jgi:catechol 2,3-dioxygenase-like lactoylglutathione lyase family enzyme
MKNQSAIATILLVAAGSLMGFVSTGPPQPAQSSETFRDLQVVLYVTDVRQSVTFYRNVLGFKLDRYAVGSANEVTELKPSDPEPYAAELIAGDQRISLQRSSDEVTLPARGARYHLEVPDPAAYYERLLTHGASVHHLVKTATGKPFMFSVTDPDGHWFFFRGPLGRK